MTSLMAKIIQALVEGNFCKKSINKIDHTFALITRKLLSQKLSIQNNKIMFMTYQNDYTCNPKYIAEEIIKQNLPLDLVWAVKNESKVKNHFPDSIRLVKRNSYAFYKEAITAKFWVDNSINFFWEDIPKSKSQILISTWHGSMGLKRVGKEDNKNLKWVKKSKRCDIDTNFCISNSDFEDDVYRKTHWETREILKYGHPRNDLLFETNEKTIAKIKEKVFKNLSIENDVKIALYAPTFRDSHNIDVYNLDYQRLIMALNERFGGKWVVLARHHFHLWNNKVADKSISNLDNVIRATDYDDMQELMLIADVGITDYSSWICDFLLTSKPGFIFATDIDEYNNERGLYYPLESTPFPIATNNEELIKNILNFDNNKYLTKVEEFLKEKGCVEDGKAAYRVVEKIKEILGDKE